VFRKAPHSGPWRLAPKHLKAEEKGRGGGEEEQKMRRSGGRAEFQRPEGGGSGGLAERQPEAVTPGGGVEGGCWGWMQTRRGEEEAQ